MLKFLIGVVVVGIIGFLVCAVISINNSEKDRNTPTLATKAIGDSDARSK